MHCGSPEAMAGREQTDRPRFGRRALARLVAVPQSYILILLSAILVGIGLLLVQAGFAQRNARASALRESETQIALGQFEKTLLNAETGQRGFLLTLDPGYLGPYHQARARLPDQLARLKIAIDTSSNPEAEERLQAIAALTRDKMAELDQTVRFAQAGAPQLAADLVRTNAGKATMDQLRLHLAALSAAQRQQRVAAFAAAEATESRQVPLFVTMWAALLLLVWASVLGERRRAAAEVAAAQADRLRELNDRSRLLAQELNHRVKNLFGVVLSLIGMSRRREGTVDQVIGELNERVHALARAHAAAFDASPDGAPLRLLLESLFDPYQDSGAMRIVLDGEDDDVAARAVTPLSLVLHELATNAAKYGALSTPEGRVIVSWRHARDGEGRRRLTLTWCEKGGPAVSGSAEAVAGFGTRMTEAVLRQLEGTIQRDWPASGAVIRLDLRTD